MQAITFFSLINIVSYPGSSNMRIEFVISPLKKGWNVKENSVPTKPDDIVQLTAV